MITFANVESVKWFITDAQKSRQEKVEKWNAEKRARGDTVIEPKKIVQNVLRVMSVGRILIAAMVPGVGVQYIFFHFRVSMDVTDEVLV